MGSAGLGRGAKGPLPGEGTVGTPRTMWGEPEASRKAPGEKCRSVVINAKGIECFWRGEEGGQQGCASSEVFAWERLFFPLER